MITDAHKHELHALAEEIKFQKQCRALHAHDNSTNMFELIDRDLHIMWRIVDEILDEANGVMV